MESITVSASSLYPSAQEPTARVRRSAIEAAVACWNDAHRCCAGELVPVDVKLRCLEKRVGKSEGVEHHLRMLLCLKRRSRLLVIGVPARSCGDSV